MSRERERGQVISPRRSKLAENKIEKLLKRCEFLEEGHSQSSELYWLCASNGERLPSDQLLCASYVD